MVDSKYTLHQVKNNEIALSLAQLSPHLLFYLLLKNTCSLSQFCIITWLLARKDLISLLWAFNCTNLLNRSIFFPHLSWTSKNWLNVPIVRQDHAKHNSCYCVKPWLTQISFSKCFRFCLKATMIKNLYNYHQIYISGKQIRTAADGLPWD